MAVIAAIFDARFASGARVEHHAPLELQYRSLQVLERLVVVALGRGDRRVAEEIANLRERNAALD